MDQERDRLKHLLIILLEALSVTPGEGGLGASRIQEKVADAGLDEADVNGLLDWIETSLNREAGRDFTGGGGQIADVAVAAADGELLAQKAADGPRLGR